MDTLRAITKWISNHRILSILAALALAALIVCSRIVIDRSQGVLSAPLRRGPIIDAVYGIGTVMATRSFAIKPGVISSITDLSVKEGDFVHKGGKLAAVDRVIYHAPFDGVVNYLPFKVGENIFTQLPILVLTDLANRYLVVTLEQQGALRIRAGQKVKLSFDSIRDQAYEGVIESAYSYNGNFLARIDVSSLPREILPDMTADVAIVIREVGNALLIPVSAYEDGYVWVKHGHMLPVKTEVKLGVVDGTTAEVISGDLHDGDVLMVRRKVVP